MQKKKKKRFLQQGKRINLDWEDTEEAARAVTGEADLDICTGNHPQNELQLTNYTTTNFANHQFHHQPNQKLTKKTTNDNK